MLERLNLAYERASASLFFVPAASILSAIGLAALMLWFDGKGVTPWPILETSPDSARSLLGTIASATITVAGVVFAITLVSIQLASSQFSPRVIPGFLRDSWQQLAMGLAVGTFTYSLLVLHFVQAPVNGTPGFVPHRASAMALVLAMVTIFALVWFLDRSARIMQVGHIIEHLTAETTHRIRVLYPQPAGTRHAVLTESRYPEGRGTVIRAIASGWVCHIDTEAILRLLPPSGIMRLDVRNGSFIASGQSIGSVWPEPDDATAFASTVGHAIVVGDSRLLLKDAAFGIRQLVDIALRALSPGINDPTTAYDVVVHLGIVMRELLWRDLAPVVRVTDDRRLVTASDLSHADYVNRAFDQIRLAGASQSAITVILLRTLGGLANDLQRDGLTERDAAVVRQAELTLVSFASTSPLPEDLARVRALAEKHGIGIEREAGTAAGSP
ncbi:MAG: DUF2254 domain-containing protein [Vicinamibacterales bacterium]